MDTPGMIVVGCGAMGGFHAQTIAGLRNATLLAVVDAAQGRAEETAGRFGCKAFRDMDAALQACPQARAVVIVTPENVRRGPLSSALAAGCAVFLEKPLALTREEGLDLAAKIKAAGVPFQIGFQRRFDPDITAVREAVRSAGRVEMFRSLTRDPEPPTLAEGLRCGIVPGTLIHDIDAAHFIGGRLASVYARAADLIGGYGQAGWLDTIVVSVEFQAGGLGTLEANWRSGYGYDSRLEVQSPAGMHQVDSAFSSRLMQHDADGRRHAYPKGFLECFSVAYRRELAGFVEALEAGAVPTPGLQEAIDSLCAADAIERSLRERRPVDVEYVEV
jgi:myo-inositol 2-dehydrogenase/D-chiro-inositol 1-dehydrogenase